MISNHSHCDVLSCIVSRYIVLVALLWIANENGVVRVSLEIILSFENRRENTVTGIINDNSLKAHFCASIRV